MSDPAYQLLFTHLQQHISLSRAEEEKVAQHFISRQLQKKELLLQTGNLCRHIYFVTEGSLRAYYVNAAGKESTVMFALPNWWITDMPCFVGKKPALVSIEALEHSQVLRLSHQALEALFAEIPAFERLFRILMQNAYVREQLRVLDTLSLSTAERYHRFVGKYPQLIQRITQKQIASYLGVTPEFLSSTLKKERP